MTARSIDSLHGTPQVFDHKDAGAEVESRLPALTPQAHAAIDQLLRQGRVTGALSEPLLDTILWMKELYQAPVQKIRVWDTELYKTLGSEYFLHCYAKLEPAASREMPELDCTFACTPTDTLTVRFFLPQGLLRGQRHAFVETLYRALLQRVFPDSNVRPGLLLPPMMVEGKNSYSSFSINMRHQDKMQKVRFEFGTDYQAPFLTTICALQLDPETYEIDDYGHGAQAVRDIARGHYELVCPEEMAPVKLMFRHILNGFTPGPRAELILAHAESEVAADFRKTAGELFAVTADDCHARNCRLVAPLLRQNVPIAYQLVRQEVTHATAEQAKGWLESCQQRDILVESLFSTFPHPCHAELLQMLFDPREVVHIGPALQALMRTKYSMLRATRRALETQFAPMLGELGKLKAFSSQLELVRVYMRYALVRVDRATKRTVLEAFEGLSSQTVEQTAFYRELLDAKFFPVQFAPARQAALFLRLIPEAERSPYEKYYNHLICNMPGKKQKPANTEQNPMVAWNASYTKQLARQNPDGIGAVLAKLIELNDQLPEETRRTTWQKVFDDATPITLERSLFLFEHLPLFERLFDDTQLAIICRKLIECLKLHNKPQGYLRDCMDWVVRFIDKVDIVLDYVSFAKHVKDSALFVEFCELVNETMPFVPNVFAPEGPVRERALKPLTVIQPLLTFLEKAAIFHKSDKVEETVLQTLEVGQLIQDEEMQAAIVEAAREYPTDTVRQALLPHFIRLYPMMKAPELMLRNLLERASLTVKLQAYFLFFVNRDPQVRLPPPNAVTMKLLGVFASTYSQLFAECVKGSDPESARACLQLHYAVRRYPPNGRDLMLKDIHRVQEHPGRLFLRQLGHFGWDNMSMLLLDDYFRANLEPIMMADELPSEYVLWVTRRESRPSYHEILHDSGGAPQIVAYVPSTIKPGGKLQQSERHFLAILSRFLPLALEEAAGQVKEPSARAYLLDFVAYYLSLLLELYPQDIDVAVLLTEFAAAVKQGTLFYQKHVLIGKSLLNRAQFKGIDTDAAVGLLGLRADALGWENISHAIGLVSRAKAIAESDHVEVEALLELLQEFCYWVNSELLEALDQYEQFIELLSDIIERHPHVCHAPGLIDVLESIAMPNYQFFGMDRGERGIHIARKVVSLLLRIQHSSLEAFGQDNLDMFTRMFALFKDATAYGLFVGHFDLFAEHAGRILQELLRMPIEMSDFERAVVLVSHTLCLDDLSTESERGKRIVLLDRMLTGVYNRYPAMVSRVIGKIAATKRLLECTSAQLDFLRRAKVIFGLATRGQELSSAGKLFQQQLEELLARLLPVKKE